ncbi:TonB family protein [Bacteriovoracaceae bacterium]|nr:TonB family protein [Bacteriovoracaceae bacterium]
MREKFLNFDFGDLSQWNLRKIALFVVFFHVLSFLFQVDLTKISFKKNEETTAIKLKLNPATLEHLRDSKKKQIAETVKSKLKYRKKDKQFLSEKNNYFDRQTIAKTVDKFNVGGSAASQAQKKQAEKKKTAKSKTKSKKIDFKKIGLTYSPKMQNESFTKKEENQRAKRKNPSSKGIGRGISASNDYVKDIPLGDFTKLNSQEYQFYGYYNRIKNKLEQFWGRNLQDEAQKIFKRGGRFPSSSNHVTSLIIVLSPEGRITAVKVKNSSGYQELDKAATDAFNQAGPFPNPPSGMIKNGMVKLEWGFVVNT